MQRDRSYPARRASLALTVVIGSVGCGPSTVAPEIKLRTEKNSFGIITCSDETADTTCVAGRSIIGVSMGSHGAGQIGGLYPELFDAIGMLGVPLVDWTYMLRNIERGYLGGFCDQATILANMQTMNDPTGHGFCGPVMGTEKITPDGKIMEPSQDFNHWYRWIDNGRGGNFGRNKLRDSFQDITLAFGNAFYYNPESTYYPPGVPLDFRSKTDEERCAHPLKIAQKIYHKEYNPDGTYPVIAFCDTKTDTGDFDPANASQAPIEMLLAVDYNQNGVRDYAEPIITFVSERYQDIGVGADAANDKYDYNTNPKGKNGNWLYDEGEPFEDNGLDGVPNTHDYGEGNGKFDYNPNVENYWEKNTRRRIEQMPEGQLNRLSIWADSGIRDFLMSAAGTNWMFGALQGRVGKGLAKDYVNFPALAPQQEEFDFLTIDYSPAGVGKHVYVRYGDPNASEEEIQRGDGHHVGTPPQLLNRFLTSMTFIQSRMRDVDRSAIDNIGNITELIQPKTFFSAALNDTRKYGIVFPPGYDDPKNKDRRYPVMYFMHGQGQESSDLLASAILFFGYMAGSTEPETVRRGESDWAKFILVFPDSTCREGECSSGNFNTNHKGINNDGPKYMDSILELIAHVEQNYRTAIPVEVPK
ncbi:MAG: hypothetical protein U1E65_24840 [Myxococcota bacterium]